MEGKQGSARQQTTPSRESTTQQQLCSPTLRPRSPRTASLTASHSLTHFFIHNLSLLTDSLTHAPSLPRLRMTFLISSSLLSFQTYT